MDIQGVSNFHYSDSAAGNPVLASLLKSFSDVSSKEWG